jgi:hypothetical protein
MGAKELILLENLSENVLLEDKEEDERITVR